MKIPQQLLAPIVGVLAEQQEQATAGLADILLDELSE